MGPLSVGLSSRRRRKPRPITARETVIQLTACVPKDSVSHHSLIKHRGSIMPLYSICSIANIAVRASLKCGNSFFFGLAAMKFPK
jgi:hypothetical protein